MLIARHFAVVVALPLFLALSSAPIAAQQTGRQPERRTAETPQLTPAQRQILQRLQQSGLSAEQIRQRLEQAGYDPRIADRYLDAIDRGAAGDSIASAEFAGLTRRIPPPDGDLLSGLRSIGVLSSADSAAAMGRLSVDTLRRDLPPSERRTERSEIFGRDLFTASAQFEPLMSGPVDPGYRLGPGDQLTLVVTGDVELAYELEVTREGYIVIPDVGQVIVNGLTLAEARRRLNERLGRVYSGIQTGTTDADVVVGRLRSKLVYVIGEVEVPSAYQVSGSATVFNAMYRAGGPAVNGSFRNIEVRRGNEVIRRVDLYDYLLRGDKSGDVTLEQGDVVFVPVVGPQVSVRGAVRRPAIYELRTGEGLRDVLAYAGGFQSDAVGRVQIDRVLPLALRRPGVDRVLVDVRLDQLSGQEGGERLQDGDIVRVFSIGTERRNRVVIEGAVHAPGLYEWAPGTTLGALIERANGLRESAYTDRALVYRYDARDGGRQMLRVALDGAAGGADDVLLMDRDSVVIFDRTQLQDPDSVAIEGHVRRPGMYALAEGMSVRDLILQAGGFEVGALMSSVEVARARTGEVRGDTTAIVFNVPTGARGSVTGDSLVNAPPVWRPEAGEFLLSSSDRVVVRPAPGYEAPRRVLVIGQVDRPGAYVLQHREERVSEVIARAGGLTNQAFRDGMQIWRDSTLIAIDMNRAITNPRSRYDITLEPGDSIFVPEYDPTVLVKGAVGFDSRVLYSPGKSLEYYISQAGGFAENADRSRVSVTYANGERATTRRILGVRDFPGVRAGSSIFVPEEPAANGSGFDWDQFLSRSLTLLSTVATLILAINQLK